MSILEELPSSGESRNKTVRKKLAAIFMMEKHSKIRDKKLSHYMALEDAEIDHYLLALSVHSSQHQNSYAGTDEETKWEDESNITAENVFITDWDTDDMRYKVMQFLIPDTEQTISHDSILDQVQYENVTFPSDFISPLTRMKKSIPVTIPPPKTNLNVQPPRHSSRKGKPSECNEVASDEMSMSLINQYENDICYRFDISLFDNNARSDETATVFESFSMAFPGLAKIDYEEENTIYHDCVIEESSPTSIVPTSNCDETCHAENVFNNDFDDTLRKFPEQITPNTEERSSILTILSDVNLSDAISIND